MPTPTNRRVWQINSVQGNEGQAPAMQELLNCTIVLDRNSNVWGFFGPRHTLEASVPPRANGRAARPPFNFPKFTSSLDGDLDKDWYIQVVTTQDPLPDKILGYWSNTHYPITGEEPIPMPGGNPFADPDTFTAQTSVGDPVEEGDQAAAAAASSKQ